MKNVTHKKSWRASEVEIHMGPPPITLIESKNDIKPERYRVKIKLLKYPTSEKSDLYEF